MQQSISTRGVMLMVVLGLYVLTGVSSSAEAVIMVRRAEVVNGVAVVEGGNAARGAPISWEGTPVTQANNGGNFSFQGVVPADCVGRLEDGVPADAVDVALANCGPASEAPAPVPQTGQTQCWNEMGTSIPCAGTGQDGDIQAGVAWPVPRFTDIGNGTVTDHLTGLIWLQDASCDTLGPNGDGTGTWQQALDAANALASPNCGLSDGSMAGDWRLPNNKELLSLTDYRFLGPALSNAAGTGQWMEGNAFSGVVQSTIYWSSTTRAGNPDFAWYVGLVDGDTGIASKALNTFPVWPVRGPE